MKRYIQNMKHHVSQPIALSLGRFALSAMTALFALSVTAADVRNVSVVSFCRGMQGQLTSAVLQFDGESDGAMRLFLLRGDKDYGAGIGAWTNRVDLGLVEATETARTVSIAEGAPFCRFALQLVDDGGDAPLAHVDGDGVHYIDTGVVLAGGDTVRARVSTMGTSGLASVFGYRNAGVNDPNIACSCESGKVMLDYVGSGKTDDYMNYRLTANDFAKDVWYDVTLSPIERKVTCVTMSAATNVVNSDTFTTGGNCLLFYVGGSPSVQKKFAGLVSSFSVERDGQFLVSLTPYRKDGHCGFLDSVTGAHLWAEGLRGELAASCSDVIRSTPTTAREVSITSVSRDARGVVVSLDATFTGNTSLNERLYLLCGEKDYGWDIDDWPIKKDLGLVAADEVSRTIALPQGAGAYRLALRVEDMSNSDGPLGAVCGTGDNYIDTKIVLQSGDKLSALVRACLASGSDESVFGYRNGSADNPNIVCMCGRAKFVLDYVGSGVAGDCEKYRLLTQETTTNVWYDVTLSAEARTISNDTFVVMSDVVNADSFVTAGSCLVFYAGGTPSCQRKFTGRLASFAIERAGTELAHYVPYRQKGICGFFDCVSGEFLKGVKSTFTGVPYAAVTPAVHSRIMARTVSVGQIVNGQAVLVFGPDNGLVNILSVAWGKTDGGAAADWEHFDRIGEVGPEMTSLTWPIPAGCRRFRFCLSLPFAGGKVGVPLAGIKADLIHVLDTGISLRGGDALRARIQAPTELRNTAESVFGFRQSLSAVYEPNILLACNSYDGEKSWQFVGDYVGSGVPGAHGLYRITCNAVSAGTWCDVLLSPARRSVIVNGEEVSFSDALNEDVFEMAGSCLLFCAGGHPYNSKIYHGAIGAFQIERGGILLADYAPCKVGDSFGYYDLATARFIPLIGGSGVPDVDWSSPLVSATPVIRLRGLVLTIR